MRNVLISSGKRKKYRFIFSGSNNIMRAYDKNTVSKRLANIMNLGSGRLSIAVDFEGDLIIGYYPTKVDHIVTVNEMVDEERSDEDVSIANPYILHGDELDRTVKSRIAGLR